jgi:hypothetical protein
LSSFRGGQEGKKIDSSTPLRASWEITGLEKKREWLAVVLGQCRKQSTLEQVERGIFACKVCFGRILKSLTWKVERNH